MPAHLSPTLEQQAILDAYLAGDSFVVQAAAGTGKTSTMRMLAQARPGVTAAYVAFNRAIAAEAAGTFPDWVDCRTAHSHAYAAVGRHLGAKLNLARLPHAAVADALGIGHVDLPAAAPVRRARLVRTKTAKLAALTVDRFAASAASQIGCEHLPPLNTVLGTIDAETLDSAGEVIMAAARKLWAARIDPASDIPASHGDYLKAWALNTPKLDADVIFFDEGQDADQVVLDVIRRQTQAQIVVVGDPAQSIYAWRGAESALEHFDGPRLPLSRSFRFGPRIAEEANVWLDLLASPVRLIGSLGIDSVVGPVRGPDAILCRTNAGVIAQIIELQAKGIAVAVAGERKAFELKTDVLAAEHLKTKGWTSHPRLWVYPSWAQLVAEIGEYETRGESHEFGLLVALLARYRADAIVAAIDSCVPIGRARVSVCTVHVAKGLEWDRVRVGPDFRAPRRDPKSGVYDVIEDDEARLGYVAVTRAKQHLDPAGVEWVHRLPGALPGPAHI